MSTITTQSWFNQFGIRAHHVKFLGIIQSVFIHRRQKVVVVALSGGYLATTGTNAASYVGKRRERAIGFWPCILRLNHSRCRGLRTKDVSGRGREIGEVRTTLSVYNHILSWLHKTLTI
jgi:hypothetical protein